MRFLFRVLFLMLFIDLLYLVFGFLIYVLGRLFSNLTLLRFGHRLIAYGDASFFGAHRKWLQRRCFRDCDCSKCDLWTCAGKEENKK